MISAHSTVPRWPAEPPCVDASGRSYLVVAFGREGEQVASGWHLEITACGLPLSCVQADADLEHTEPALVRLRTILGTSHTGLRLMVAGPEQEVLAAQSAARAAGMIDAELALHVTATDCRRVYCVHCKTTSAVRAEVEDVAACHGCGRELLIFAHLSRRSGSYLGFLADAEERE